MGAYENTVIEECTRKELEHEFLMVCEELRKFQQGYQGACWACEPVGMLNMELEVRLGKLRAMLSWAAGRLLDAGDVEGHEKVMATLYTPGRIESPDEREGQS